MAKNLVGIVMGGAQIGPERTYKTVAQVNSLLQVLKRHNVNEIDSAHFYDGSEALLGQAEAGAEYTISTKAFGGFKPGTLKSELMVPEALDALKRLNVKQVDIFYIHAPDSTVDMADYLSGVQELYKKGMFRRFGLSNYQAADVENVYNFCKQNNYVLPSVYQGNYNAVARKQETVLFPTLRKLSIAFYAYSPIAGGFLTKSREEVEGGAGRFEKGTRSGDLYINLYARNSLLEALSIWDDLAKREGVQRGEMAYRWIRFHSMLDASRGDKVIIAARTPEQVDSTLSWLDQGPLSNECVHGIDTMWKTIEEKGESPLDNYHR